MDNNYKTILEVLIDESSLSDIQKQLAKEKLKLTAEVSIDNLEGTKSEFKNQITKLFNSMNSSETIKKISESVKEVDSAMTKLYKTTNKTNIEYWSLLQNASKTSSLTGRTLVETIDQTTAWVKLGYSLEQAEKLAQTSFLYSNISSTDDKTAITTIDAAMKAFNITAENSTSIIDKLNALSSKYIITSTDLGTSLSISANTMAQSGNSIDETLALLTSLTEITKDASESSNILNILSLRIRGMQEELKALGENSYNINTINKIQSQILKFTNGKVNIFDDMDPDGFRSTYEILSAISREWKNISKTDQSALLKIIADSQNSDTISTLIANMAQADSALNDSLNSNGSAMEAQEKWMQSLESKTKQFESSFQSLSATILNSNLPKFFITLGTGIVSALDSIISRIGAIETIGLSAFAFINKGESNTILPFMEETPYCKF